MPPSTRPEVFEGMDRRTIEAPHLKSRRQALLERLDSRSTLERKSSQPPYLQTSKRFSLEGEPALIPLSTRSSRGIAEHGAVESVIGHEPSWPIERDDIMRLASRPMTWFPDLKMWIPEAYRSRRCEISRSALTELMSLSSGQGK